MVTRLDNLLPWFRLKSTPGIGNHLFKRLLDTFGDVESIYQAEVPQLTQVEGISQKTANAIRRHMIPDKVKRDIDLAARMHIKIVTMVDREYPPLLLQIPDPPPFLYIDGTLDNDIRNIAVVGSRKATQYGLSTAKQLSAELSVSGIRIISGMARGIDTAAHEGALSAKGLTIAVLGSGLANIYPPENKMLYDRIRQNGAVISEFPMSAAPVSLHFPMRNRVISGMALGTLVVEAARRSGSLITARLAAEQGREVFAVPGNIHSGSSSGTHALLKQGAKLVECADDILEEIAPQLINGVKTHKTAERDRPANRKVEKLDPDQTCVLNALEPYPIHIDILAEQTKMAPGKIAGILLELELLGKVRQSPGKLFSICEDSFWQNH